MLRPDSFNFQAKYCLCIITESYFSWHNLTNKSETEYRAQAVRKYIYLGSFFS